MPRRPSVQNGDLPPKRSKVTRPSGYIPTRGARDSMQPRKSRTGKTTSLGKSSAPSKTNYNRPKSASQMGLKMSNMASRMQADEKAKQKKTDAKYNAVLGPVAGKVANTFRRLDVRDAREFAAAEKKRKAPLRAAQKASAAKKASASSALQNRMKARRAGAR